MILLVRISVWIIFTLSISVAIGLTIYYAFILRQRYLLGEANRRLIEAKANRENVFTTTAPAGHQIIVSDLRSRRNIAIHLEGSEEWLLWNQLHQKRIIKQPDNRLIESGQVIQPPLLESLMDEQKVLILGASGSGKSSLLKHVVSRKLDTYSQVVLCDPNGSHPKWGQRIDAIGFGEDFEAILSCFRSLEWEYTQRIKQIANGRSERDFPLILVVIEEVPAIVDYCNENKINISHFIKLFLNKSRKAGIDTIAVAQAKTVTALGLKGFSESVKAFSIVKTLGSNGKGHRIEYTNEYGEILEYDPPPLWPEGLPVGVTEDKIAILRQAPDSTQLKIIDVLLTNPVASDYQICKEVFGKQGTSYKDKIEQVRQLFGPF